LFLFPEKKPTRLDMITHTPQLPLKPNQAYHILPIQTIKEMTKRDENLQREDIKYLGRILF
jgi:hypothetical protein